MFGRKWEQAEGTVVDKRITGYQPVGVGYNESPLHEFIVDVHKGDGTTFRTTIEESHDGKMLPPNVGAVVRVEVDPKTQKVRFDESDPSVNTKAQLKRMNERSDSFNETLAAPPDTSPEPQEDRGSGS